MTDEIPAFDLYGELEVSERASVETIQAAYRSLQRRSHPDVAGPAGAATAARLNVARDWLTDPALRARYDAHLERRRQSTIASEDAGAARRAAASRPDERAAAPDDQSDGREADAAEAEAEDDAAPTAAGAPPALRLRLDPGRLVRVWLVGLAFIGALELISRLDVGATLSIVLAVAVLLALLAVTVRRIRTDPDAGLRERLTRTGWSLAGWLLLAVLAAEGVVSASSDGRASAEPAIVPVLAATALMSALSIRRRVLGETTIDEFLAMTPTEFETAVGEILGRHGYRLRRTGGPGDLVADLVGTDPRGRPTVVQCKRYAPGHPVGSRDVQLLIAMGMRHHDAERLVLVTTSDFTDPAADLAETHQVRLVAGTELEALTH